MAKIQSFTHKDEVVITSDGEVQFDTNGFASVDEEVAQEWYKSFPQDITVIVEVDQTPEIPVVEVEQTADETPEIPAKQTIASETTDQP